MSHEVRVRTGHRWGHVDNVDVARLYFGLDEEMEHAARFMARGGDARQQADGLDALMRSVVQLPTYLERVLGGGRDLALVLLPLLNDLRAVRGGATMKKPSKKKAACKHP